MSRGPNKRRGTPEWHVWMCMRQRCRVKPNYRDVVVCERWLFSYQNFLADMGRKPTPRHTIDRIDNDKGYSPENCRWATPSEQQRNTKRTKLTDESVRQIRWLLEMGYGTCAVARAYGVHNTTVSHLRAGRSWAGAQ